MGSLSQDTCRRLKRMDPERTIAEQVTMLNKFDDKLITSGYSPKQRTSILIAGIRIFQAKLTTNDKENKIYIYRDMTGKKDRKIGKMSEKCIWFYKKKKNNKKYKNKTTYNRRPSWRKVEIIHLRTLNR